MKHLQFKSSPQNKGLPLMKKNLFLFACTSLLIFSPSMIFAWSSSFNPDAYFEEEEAEEEFFEHDSATISESKKPLAYLATEEEAEIQNPFYSAAVEVEEEKEEKKEQSENPETTYIVQNTQDESLQDFFYSDSLDDNISEANALTSNPSNDDIENPETTYIVQDARDESSQDFFYSNNLDDSIPEATVLTSNPFNDVAELARPEKNDKYLEGYSVDDMTPREIDIIAESKPYVSTEVYIEDEREIAFEEPTPNAIEQLEEVFYSVTTEEASPIISADAGSQSAEGYEFVDAFYSDTPEESPKLVDVVPEASKSDAKIVFEDSRIPSDPKAAQVYATMAEAKSTQQRILEEMRKNDNEVSLIALQAEALLSEDEAVTINVSDAREEEHIAEFVITKNIVKDEDENKELYSDFEELSLEPSAEIAAIKEEEDFESPQFSSESVNKEYEMFFSSMMKENPELAGIKEPFIVDDSKEDIYSYLAMIPSETSNAANDLRSTREFLENNMNESSDEQALASSDDINKAFVHLNKNKTDSERPEKGPKRLPPVSKDTTLFAHDIGDEHLDPPPVDFILRNHAKNLKKATGLKWISSRGADKHPVDHISLVYEAYNIVDIDEAQQLLVYTVETLLEELNNDFRFPNPELKDEILTANDLSVTILFDSFFGRFVDHQYVAKLRMDKGEVVYHAYNCYYKKKNESTCCEKRNETYTQSLDSVLIARDLGELKIDALRTPSLKVFPSFVLSSTDDERPKKEHYY
jgi:hypothetical protein